MSDPITKPPKIDKDAAPVATKAELQLMDPVKVARYRADRLLKEQGIHTHFTVDEDGNQTHQVGFRTKPHKPRKGKVTLIYTGPQRRVRTGGRWMKKDDKIEGEAAWADSVLERYPTSFKKG